MLLQQNFVFGRQLYIMMEVKLLKVKVIVMCDFISVFSIITSHLNIFFQYTSVDSRPIHTCWALGGIMLLAANPIRLIDRYLATRPSCGAIHARYLVTGCYDIGTYYIIKNHYNTITL